MMFCLHSKKLQHSIEINNIRLNSSICFKFRKTLADQVNFIKATLAFGEIFVKRVQEKLLKLDIILFIFHITT